MDEFRRGLLADTATLRATLGRVARSVEVNHDGGTLDVTLPRQSFLGVPKGPRMYTMSPPLQGSNLVEGSIPEPVRAARPPRTALLRLSLDGAFTPTPPTFGQDPLLLRILASYPSAVSPCPKERGIRQTSKREGCQVGEGAEVEGQGGGRKFDRRSGRWYTLVVIEVFVESGVIRRVVACLSAEADLSALRRKEHR